jgi:protein TonB
MFQPPALIRTIRPQYPSMARTARVEGAVRFTATVGQDGTVRRLDLLSGPEMLVEAAREACMQWIYRPAILDGAPMETTTIIEVRFTLSH